jgi:hypothetical protein
MKHASTLVVGFALITACSSESITKDTNDLRAVSIQSFGASVNRDLARLRQVTSGFQDFNTASNAGWSAQITPCMTDPGGAGGMGFHYGNVGLINGTATVENPQLLLYEPESNGRLRLVAVEYIIPYSFHPRSAAPPRLFNQDFQQVDAFQLWGLHAWVWRDNPSGIFAAWNPQVNCLNATASVSMSH